MTAPDLGAKRQIALASREPSTHDPMRALRGVSASSSADAGRPEVIVPLLMTAQENDAPGLQEGLCDLLLGLPREVFAGQVGTSATRWVWQRAESAAEGSTMPGPMLGVWDMAAEAAFASDAVPTGPPSKNATLDDALNSAGGMLAVALLVWIGKRKWSAGEGFGPVLSPRLDRLVAASGIAGLHARLLLVRELAFLDYVDPAWTGSAVVPRLTWGEPEAPSLWLARAGRPVGSASLFNALKPAFLQALMWAGERGHRPDGLANDLMRVASLKQSPRGEDYDLDWPEVRATLSRAQSAARRSASWLLWRWMAGEKDEVFDHADRWRRSIGPLFGHTWPLDVAAQDEKTSRNLAWMALECEEAFPDAVEEVEDFIVPFEVIVIEGWLTTSKRHKEAAHQHPRTFVRLLDKMLDPSPPRIPGDLGQFLDAFRTADPAIASEMVFVRLDGLRRKGDA